ncbi:MAG TPA: sigma-70 family RNA polymerase sigma factor [Solirubrobacteraceae bacterium]|jgi:RNA polymerase sigma-70 factor (ECF subfamily)|nr:sigma-70 family RNA polymerase sigma factor [Solirubrobacteraceae bacterium]
MAAALERATERASTEADGRVREPAPPSESTPALRTGMITPHGRGSRESLATPGLVAQAVKRAQAGDRQALGFLYARYADNVYGYVRSIVHDQHEAEDITQHVFAKLIHVIGKYEERDVPFFAWILRVARNVAVDHIRRHRAIPVEEVRAVDDCGRGPEDGERMNDLREALAVLPHDQREVLVLRHFAGLSPGEIARRTGRTEGSVHGLHHRGRRALTAELSRRGAAPATARSGAAHDEASADSGSGEGSSGEASSGAEASG